MRITYFIILSMLLAITACGKDQPTKEIQSAEHAAEDTIQKSPESPVLSTKSSWPMFMHDVSYRGISSDAILKPPLALIWKFKTGGPVDSSPVVVDGTVYVGSDDHRLYALHTHKWGVKWEFEAGDKIITAPTVYEGTVYFSARNNKVYALDAATGVKKWEYQADGWLNSPVVASRQRIYFGCYDRKIYILNSVTGKKESERRSSVEVGSYNYISSQGEFYPMDARQRASKWKQRITFSESWPATTSKFVYIGARDNKLHAFDSSTGQDIWQFDTEGWVDSSPAIADGMLYVGSRDGYIYAFGNAGSIPDQRVDDSTKDIGVVTSDGARVYSQLDNMAGIVARLNADRTLRIADRKPDWYQVILPDGQTGWMSKSVFTPIRWSEDLQVSAPLVNNVKRVSLPLKAEMPSWSPDGSTLAFFDNMATQGIYRKAESIWLADADGSNPTWVANGSFYNLRISWSGNGEWFTLENLSHTERQVWMVRYNSMGLRKVTEGEAPSISPRGTSIAFIRRDKVSTSIWVHKLDTDKQEKLAEIPVQGQESYAVYSYIADLNLPTWSPGGSRLAVGLDGQHYPDNYSRVVVLSASGGIFRAIAARARRIGDVAWSPDGKYLAYVTQEHPDREVTRRLDKQIHIADLLSYPSRNGDDKELERKEVFQHCEGIAWSPDGKYLTFIEENDCMGMKRKVWLLNMTNWQRVQLLASRENIRRVAWLAKGMIALLASSTPSETAPATRGWIVSIGQLPE